MTRLTSILALLLLSPLAVAGEASLGEAVNSIQSGEIKRHVDTLADDSFEGREAGSRGGRAAGNYIVEFLKAHGLKPAGDKGTYFQWFGSEYRNILAMLPGKDPQLAEQVIIVGAHYDHVGYGNSTNSFGPTGYIHNGADDNASGTSGLLEVVEAFSKLAEPPQRSVLFVFWDGEEKGLLGSKHWLQDPTINLSRVKFYINLDMIGRLRKGRVEVSGGRTSHGLRRLITNANEGTQLALDFDWEVKPNSDHHPFYERSIPFVMLHTGLHDQYHRPQDDVEFISCDGAESVSRMAFQLVWMLANEETSRSFRDMARREGPSQRKQFESAYLGRGSRLGIRWATDEEMSDGLTVKEVTPGSPASRAGVRAGDKIVQFAGLPVNEVEQFLINVQASPNDTTITVARDGEAEPLELPLTLNEKPSPLGIRWRADEANGDLMFLTSVVPGSLASACGLMTGDRVYEANGQKFSDGNQFYELVTDFTKPLRLVVERQGRLSTIEVETSKLHAILGIGPMTEEPTTDATTVLENPALENPAASGQ
ncbi:M20/M25/M40 family metallo-hydrolase [Blastopirellula sp. JC732]|uniref:M20/M25/M40 family metallo-hydrolase n=1 Tax=Blastopirellula sediminis TaxID=2894196 RepID=A0A9X1MIL9_9BACT|nr:M20/M25/M40 family metallo-hydrolase [Blastopirellula sediminis]MCC9608235.1 M20/M25/M40 family metallo-hydrolase [Blastopirellula sediminis]MCC9626972.1 M20/M25/M40 family metallo-hydrolase [Blastopirellula sediminis]